MSETNFGMPDSPFLIERVMRDTRRRHLKEDFAGEEEFQEKMRDDISQIKENQNPTTRLDELKDIPEELAQELAYQAFESADQEKADELTQKALEIDPTCVDALTIRAFLDCKSASELIESLEHALRCGEKSLGEEFFAEYMGDFWPQVEARPYLRTVKQLAEVLWSVGRRFDAVEQYANLVDLDPEDHTGDCVLLLSCYLAMGEVQRSWSLLEEYDDESAVFKWSWVLCLLLAGDYEAAENALKDAMETNPYVAPHLLGMGEPMEGNPVRLAGGSPEEGQVTARILADAWVHHPDGQIWLHSRLVDMGLISMDDGLDAPSH